MHFLYAVPAEHTYAGDGMAKASQGEPVVPWFPTTPQNTFVGIESFGFTPYAEVLDQQDVDLDLYLRRLCKQYPGLPEVLHRRYVIETAKAAASFAQGTKFQIFTDSDTAKLKVRDHDTIVTLWTKQPLEG